MIRSYKAVKWAVNRYHTPRLTERLTMPNVRTLIASGLICSAIFSLAGCKSAPRLSVRDQQAYSVLRNDAFFSFKNSRFSDAVMVLRDVYKLNIYVDWEVLDWFGIDGDKRVTVKGFIPLEQGLLEMLGQISNELEDPEIVGYGLLDGVVIVSLSSQLDRGGFTPIHYAPENQETFISHKRITKVVNFKHEDVELQHVLTDLRKQTKVPFFIDWEALEPLGAKMNLKVDMGVGRIRADMALHLLLRRLNRRIRPKKDGVGYLVIDGVMCVSTGSGLEKLAKQHNRFPPAPPKPKS